MTICGPNNQSLSRAQLYSYANQAGFTGSAADTIVAIALAESGGETGNCNLNDPYGGSFGVLQINGSHFLSGTTTKDCAFSPLCAFQFAWSLSAEGTNFTPWSTYTGGNFRQYLTPGGAGSTTVPLASSSSSPTFSNPILNFGEWIAELLGESAPGNTATPPIQAPTSVISGFQAFFSWISNPVRIIKMVVGVVLVGVSVAVLFHEPTEQFVTKSAATVARVRHIPTRIRQAAQKGTKQGSPKPPPKPKPAPKPKKPVVKGTKQASPKPPPKRQVLRKVKKSA